jgi:hypothetical protein
MFQHNITREVHYLAQANRRMALHAWRPMRVQGAILYFHGLQSHAGWLWSVGNVFANLGSPSMRWIVKVAASAAARNTGSRMFVRFTRMHGLPLTIFAAKCLTMFRSACSGIASVDRYLLPLPVAPTVSCPTTISSSAQPGWAKCMTGSANMSARALTWTTGKVCGTPD